MTPKQTPWLDFEKPLVELEERIRTLEDSASLRGLDVSGEVDRLRDRVKTLGREIFENLDAWQRVQLARHPRRPTTNDYIERIFDGFVELHGDRQYRDDPAIVCGLAKLGDRHVVSWDTRRAATPRATSTATSAWPTRGYRKTCA